MDLLWWMGLIFCDLGGGGWKMKAVVWVFEGCDWRVCGLSVVVRVGGERDLLCLLSTDF